MQPVIGFAVVVVGGGGRLSEVAVSSLARILGKGWTIRSPPALKNFF